MPTYVFEKYDARGEKRLPCPVCGKKVTRAKTFWMTDNPWNLNADGSRRSILDIRFALTEQIRAWQKVPEAHSKCLEVTDV